MFHFCPWIFLFLISRTAAKSLPRKRKKCGLGLQVLIHIQTSKQNFDVMPKQANSGPTTEQKTSGFFTSLKSLFGYYQHKCTALLPVQIDYKVIKNKFLDPILTCHSTIIRSGEGVLSPKFVTISILLAAEAIVQNQLKR